MKKHLSLLLLFILFSAFISFCQGQVIVGANGYGPGFYFVGGDGNGDWTPPQEEQSLEIIATGYKQFVHPYNSNGDYAYHYSQGYDIFMELYLPISDIDDRFVNVDNITQFYGRFIDSDSNLVIQGFYKVVYIFDYYQIPRDDNGEVISDIYFTRIDHVYNYAESQYDFLTLEVDALDVTSMYDIYNFLSTSTVTVNDQFLGFKNVYHLVHSSVILIPIYDPIYYGDFIGGFYLVYIDPILYSNLSWGVINISSSNPAISILYYSSWTNDFLDDLIIMNVGWLEMNKKLICILALIFATIILISCSSTTHNVSFIIGDGIDAIIKEVKTGEQVARLDDPIKDNYQFLGWYTSLEFNQEFNFEQEINSDVIIYARFSHFELGKENYIAFKEDGLYGFMLPTGEIVIEAKYDKVEPFRYGYALVQKDGNTTFIDVLGNEFSEWHQAHPAVTNGYLQFSQDGLSKVYIGNGITKIINTHGEVLYEIENNQELRVEFASFYSDGLIPITLFDGNGNRSECVYYNQQGEVTLQNNYLSCSVFTDGVALVLIPSIDTYASSYVLIDPTGEILFETTINEVYYMFDGIKPVIFKEGYAIGRILSVLGEETTPGKYVVIDNQGQVVLEFDTDRPIDVSGGYVLTVNSENYYAIYDLEGNLILNYSEEYKDLHYYASAISDGMVVLSNNQNMYGAFSVSTGEIIIDFEYQALMMFIDGYAVAKKNGLYGIIDLENNTIVDFVYEDMFSVAKTIIN